MLSANQRDNIIVKDDGGNPATCLVGSGVRMEIEHHYTIIDWVFLSTGMVQMIAGFEPVESVRIHCNLIN